MSNTISTQHTSWVSILPGSDFPIQNLPFGVYQSSTGPHICVAIGEQMVDVAELSQAGLLKNTGVDAATLEAGTLNALFGNGREAVSAVRNRIGELLETSNTDLKLNPDLRAKALVPQAGAQMLMPVQVGDYTDFYSSRDHAFNVGSMFRDPDNALLPNWLHLPVGYHGRASSIVVSGTPIRRPKGQTRPDKEAPPVFGPCRLLDFELEMAFVCGKGTQMGESIPIDKTENHIAGMVLFNDWSARDIQTWEYIPLGPFLAKNFASSVSPWVVTLDALEPFRIQGPAQDPAPLPYLKSDAPAGFNINLEVFITPEGGEPHQVSLSNFKNMYWSMQQQLAHHTVNGCNINPGDMCASGTISGPTPESYGSMLEISWRGTKPVKMPDGTERKFINDGDTVTMKGYCEKDGLRIGFGEVSGKLLPAN